MKSSNELLEDVIEVIRFIKGVKNAEQDYYYNKMHLNKKLLSLEGEKKPIDEQFDFDKFICACQKHNGVIEILDALELLRGKLE